MRVISIVLRILCSRFFYFFVSLCRFFLICVHVYVELRAAEDPTGGNVRQILIPFTEGLLVVFHGTTHFPRDETRPVKPETQQDRRDKQPERKWTQRRRRPRRRQHDNPNN